MSSLLYSSSRTVSGTRCITVTIQSLSRNVLTVVVRCGGNVLSYSVVSGTIVYAGSNIPAFRRHVTISLMASMLQQIREPCWIWSHLGSSLPGLLHGPQGGVSRFFQNVSQLPYYMMSHPRRLPCWIKNCELGLWSRRKISVQTSPQTSWRVLPSNTRFKLQNFKSVVLRAGSFYTDCKRRFLYGSSPQTKPPVFDWMLRKKHFRCFCK
jgi:hypothetical protein